MCIFPCVAVPGRARSNVISSDTPSVTRMQNAIRAVLFSYFVGRKSVTSLLLRRKNRISIHVCVSSVLNAQNRMQPKQEHEHGTEWMVVYDSNGTFFSLRILMQLEIGSYLLEITSFIYSMHFSRFSVRLNAEMEDKFGGIRHLLGVKYSLSLKSDIQIGAAQWFSRKVIEISPDTSSTHIDDSWMGE